MPLTLFLDLMSQPCRAVLLFCLENEIDHQVQTVHIGKGETKSAQFRAINPTGKVPAIDHNGFVLAESHAILAYLVNTRHVPDHWYPKDPKKRAKVDEILHWHHANLRFGASGFAFSTIIGPRMGFAPDERLTKDSRATLESSLKFMDGILGKSPFIAGGEMSIADLSLACELAQILVTDFDFSVYTHVVSWFNKVQRLPNYRKVTTVLDKVIANTKKHSQAGVKSLAPSGAASGSASDDVKKLFKSALVFDEIRRRIPEDGPGMVKDLNATYRFECSTKDKEGKTVKYSWFIDAKNGEGAVKDNNTESKADCTFILSDDDFINLASGKSNPQMAFMSGKMKIKGNLPKALKFDAVVLKKRGKEIKEVLKQLQTSKL